MTNIDGKLKVGLLGATGAVGQRFIQLLSNHPQMEIHCLGASSKSAGNPYNVACQKWLLETPMPPRIAQKIVQECEPKVFNGCQIVFSALDSSVAGPIGK
jgi:aspartate-semialdehyde dehydrogenase